MGFKRLLIYFFLGNAAAPNILEHRTDVALYTLCCLLNIPSQQKHIYVQVRSNYLGKHSGRERTYPKRTESLSQKHSHLVDAGI